MQQLKELAAQPRPDRQQLQDVTLQLHGHLALLSTHQLSRVATTFARLNWRPGITLRAIAGRALERLPDFHPSDLVWLLWAMGKLQYDTQAAKKLAKESLALLLLELQQQPAGAQRAQ